MSKIAIYIFLFIAFLGPQGAKAQINLLVGYDLKVGIPEEINNSINHYNSENPNFSKKMRNVRIMNGFLIGTRYSIGALSIEGHYLPSFKNLLAEREEADLVYKKYFRLNNLALGAAALVQIRPQTAVGVSWQQNSFQIARKFDSERKFIKGFAEPVRYQTLKVFLSFSNELNSLMKVHLRPYYEFGLGGDNLVQGEIDANLSMPARNTVTKTNWGAFGLQLIVGNGPQK